MWRIFGGRKREVELDEELQSHLDIEAARLEAEGSAKEEAAMQARQGFGSRALVAEQTRDSWGARWLTGVRQDFEYALRSGRRTPAFGAAVTLSLALGIGAATVIFSVADTVYLRPLPYPRAKRINVCGDANLPAGDGAFTRLRSVAERSLGIPSLGRYAVPRREPCDLGRQRPGRGPRHTGFLQFHHYAGRATGDGPKLRTERGTAKRAEDGAIKRRTVAEPFSFPARHCWTEHRA